MTTYISEEDRPFQEKLISLADDQTVAWVNKKSNEFIRLLSYYRCAMMQVETKLNILNEEFSLHQDHNPINSIKSRLKKPKSLQGKLERKGLPMSMGAIEEHIEDMAGIRVVCSFQDDVYMIEKALLKQDDISLVSREDYIAHPKENGYRSLHLILAVPIYLASERRVMKVEVQLRTISMDCWASLEHQLRYKKNRNMPNEINNELKLCADLSAELDKRMSKLQLDLQPE